MCHVNFLIYLIRNFELFREQKKLACLPNFPVGLPLSVLTNCRLIYSHLFQTPLINPGSDPLTGGCPVTASIP